MSQHDVLILGVSSLVQKRVLPALLGLDRVGTIHVASRSQSEHPLGSHPRAGGRWRDYDTALRECEPCLAYVSLPNSMHAEWVEAALRRGFHVIVDKPAVGCDYERARELVDLAVASSRVLAEASVWTWHPLARRAKEIVSGESLGTKAVIAVFTSPPLDPGNFRYRRDLGGGAFLDRSSYAASCGRFFFDQRPLGVSCAVLGHAGPDGVDTAFSAVLRYPTGVLLGYFSLASEYQNRVEIIGDSVACTVERAFTPPAEFQGSIAVRSHDRASRIDVPAQDSFALFLDDVVTAIERHDVATHSSALIEDARVIELMHEAAGG